MKGKTESRSIIMCCKDGHWKKEVDRRLQTCDSVTLMALGRVKSELLRYLNKREDIEVLKMETRYMKKREKGMGLKVIVRRKQKPKNEKIK